MNGKKAKLFRSLAGVDSKDSNDRVYQVDKRTLRDKVIRNLAGDITHKFTTGTYVMVSCPRLLCKALKKNYLKGKRK